MDEVVIIIFGKNLKAQILFYIAEIICKYVFKGSDMAAIGVDAENFDKKVT